MSNGKDKDVKSQNNQNDRSKASGKIVRKASIGENLKQQGSYRKAMEIPPKPFKKNSDDKK